MNKSVTKTIFKTAIITLAILLILAGAFNPLTYYLGKENTATCDSVSFSERTDGLYDIDIRYHYFASGREYSGSAKLTGEYDESIALKMHYVKYLPFLPSLEILEGTSPFPQNSIVFCASGLILLVLGIFIKTTKRKPKKDKKETLVKKAFVCPACQKEIDSDSIYCNYCGRKILF